MAFGLTFDNVIGHVNIAEGSNEVPVRTFNFNREVASVTMPDSDQRLVTAQSALTVLTEFLHHINLKKHFPRQPMNLMWSLSLLS